VIRFISLFEFIISCYDFYFYFYQFLLFFIIIPFVPVTSLEFGFLVPFWQHSTSAAAAEWKETSRPAEA